MRRGLALIAVAAVVAVAPARVSAATISAADRAAIDRVLDVWIPAAVGRVRSERAWPLATVSLRSGSTRTEWRAGTMPVQPFAVKGKTFHGWTADAAGPRRADIVLLVHLKPGGDLGAVSLDVTMRKVAGNWLVDSTTVAATFPAKKGDLILAQPDFAPGASPHQPQSFTRTGRIDAKWALIIPGILLGLIVTVPFGVLVVHRMRERSRRDSRGSDPFGV